ncbi:hypothetical protein [Nonomuraea sp. NPDC001831]|uniref:hypothetical protein n=1 Tax=Nonomuraea sp. NPDC001831 TaxID=3364340 RepID=UPI0036A692E1
MRNLAVGLARPLPAVILPTLFSYSVSSHENASGLEVALLLSFPSDERKAVWDDGLSAGVRREVLDLLEAGNAVSGLVGDLDFGAQMAHLWRGKGCIDRSLDQA